ncbi:hypothetical protein Tco_0390337 [Tanacetum coccineum]
MQICPDYVLNRLFSECGDGVAGIKRRRHDLSGDGIRNLATASGHGRLKEDLEFIYVADRSGLQSDIPGSLLCPAVQLTVLAVVPWETDGESILREACQTRASALYIHVSLQQTPFYDYYGAWILSGPYKTYAGEEVAEEVVEVINNAKLIIDATQVSAASDKVSTASAAVTVSAATTTTATITILGESTTTISSQLPSQQSHDKGKGILIEPVKKKDQILLDKETALNLQAKFDEEERRTREKAAKIDADHQLAERLQAQEQEELSVEEKATLFQQLLEKRRKHFAAKRAEEKRNKPPTKAQQRKIMCTYLKNMEGYKLNDLKLKDFDSIQEMFDRAFKRVNTFEDFRTELVEGKEKRAGTELAQEITKKQKVEDDKETTEIKKLMEIIPDEEEVAIDAIPLAVKSPSIVDWKIHKEGRKSYYQIIRADGKSQMYMIFSHMLKSFDREDLETLYKLVKDKCESTRPVEDLDLIL